MINILFDTAGSNPMLEPQPPAGKEYSNDPVFYGPDGNVLTEEESAFLWNATSGPSETFYDDDDEYVSLMKFLFSSVFKYRSIYSTFCFVFVFFF